MTADFHLVLTLITIQALLGGFDNLWHHELTEGLPGRISARREIALHSARELIYALVFLTLAWTQPLGLLAWLFAAILGLEVVITLADFLEEDRTRTLPPFERVLHTILALNYGAVLVLLAPHILGWAQQDTGLAEAYHGLWTWVFTLFAAGVLAWGIRDAIAGVSLYRRARMRLAGPVQASGRSVLVTGATGFLGQALVARLLARGDQILVLSRDVRKARALLGPRVSVFDDLALIAPQTRIDAIINLAGANVADMPWWPARRRVLIDSRLAVTTALASLIARLDTRPEVLVSASAIGAYGSRGETPLTECASRPLGVFTADLCRVWEMAAQQAAGARMRVCLLRFGLVLGRDGGALPRLVMTRPFGLVPQFGDGRQWMSWIHKEDALGVLERCLDDRRLAGPINVVAPCEGRHGRVVRAIAGRRLVLPVPAWALRMLLGEMAELFLASQRVQAQSLTRLGHSFRYREIESAIANLCEEPAGLKGELVHDH